MLLMLRREPPLDKVQVKPEGKQLVLWKDWCGAAALQLISFIRFSLLTASCLARVGSSFLGFIKSAGFT